MCERLGFGLYMVEALDDGRPVGMCGLIKRDTLEDVDLGFAFLPAYRGQGYAGESARASLRQAARLGMKRVVAIVSFENPPSIALLERLGFVFEKPILMPGETEEIAFYGLTLDSSWSGQTGA